MNPNQRVVCRIFTGRFGEEAVDVLEVLPVGAVVGEVLWKGVQNGPERFF